MGVAPDRYRAAPPDLLAVPLAEPGDLDRMWGAFAASGDVAYPRRLVDLLDAKHGATPPSAKSAALLGAARWSLAANRRQHAAVRRLISDEADRRTGPAGRILAEMELAEPVADAPPDGPMTKTVTRVAYPGPAAGSFQEQPVTLYRIGEKYGRVEEAADPALNVHALIVIAEPRVWMINLADGSARRIVDPGPTFAFHAPVISEAADGVAPPLLEYGFEYEFLERHGARADEVTVDGKTYEKRVATVDGYTITLLGTPGAREARRLEVARGGEKVIAVEYLEYLKDLPPRMDLFVPPKGLKLVQAPAGR